MISGCYCTDINKYSNSNLIVGYISGCYCTDINKHSNNNLILGYISGCYCTDVNKYSNSNHILGYTLGDLKEKSLQGQETLWGLYIVISIEKTFYPIIVEPLNLESQISYEHSRGSPEFPNTNLRQIGQGVPE